MRCFDREPGAQEYAPRSNPPRRAPAAASPMWPGLPAPPRRSGNLHRRLAL
eukprot:CAMPEP_0176323816 /NCGR_PEP_ID=MMETSP0121_2-20121125/72580_1 /TAXON_ID=160619 /ORGANISM="Kryptoperidinium foliaceum, Strain CCMP 1326" /LENGTH=50 /DNA_ID=CAMNT_0017666343 /DNA_START=54 /DNA_END=206 /DNA_ORIENTATION=-